MSEQQIINEYINQVNEIYKQLKIQKYNPNKDVIFEIFHYSLKICHKIDNLKAKNVLSTNYNYIRECFDNFAKDYCSYNNFLGKKIFTLDDIDTKQQLKKQLFNSFCSLEKNINSNFAINTKIEENIKEL